MVYECAIITVTIYATQVPDMDNAMASAKPIVDGLKGLVIRDDSHDKCDIRIRVQKVNHKNEEHVEVEVQPCPNPNKTK